MKEETKMFLVGIATGIFISAMLFMVYFSVIDILK